MATHSGILAWKIPRTEEPRGLESKGSQVTESDTTEHALSKEKKKCFQYQWDIFVMIKVKKKFFFPSWTTRKVSFSDWLLEICFLQQWDFMVFQAFLRLGLFLAHQCLYWRMSIPHFPFGWSWLAGLPWIEVLFFLAMLMSEVIKSFSFYFFFKWEDNRFTILCRFLPYSASWSYI